ncbi:hypothetical protein BJV82DRAFT_609230 [Fennellomyces sp. T-0311]|nr:hypothetical protein BJV82DRAFT_609230 [Fennellomyces sp. T-0311]
MATTAADKTLILPSSIAPGRVFLSPIPTTYSTSSDMTAVSQGSVMIVSRKTSSPRDEECCFYYSKISSTMDEEEDEDTDTVLTGKDDSCTVFSTTPSSFDTALSPISENDTIVVDAKLPRSPPLSPPLSPTTLSNRPRFPRWIKQISAPNMMTTTTSSIPSREPSFKSSLLPPRLMRRMMMPPNVEQHVSVALPAATALYYGSTHVRKYLHEVMKPNRFDEMLLSGFDSMCPVHSMEFNNDDQYSIMTDESDDSASCQCDHRQMTLRITLTPAHCRATETEIYGHNRQSHRGKRTIAASISTPTRSTTTVTKKYPKDPTPTLSLPPLPRHDNRPPLYVVNPSKPHIQPQLATKSSFYCNHHPPVLVLPTNTRRQPQK